ncbi:hypothetical protein HMI54_005062 [Coelomomyces lativittatus]|nr:hypothetical protein HMI54_005062 [Coelomomyces lativittatus]KAJ1513814.1 hypothetical protein HMI56_001735 [Coelomomyces lativittatus]KAJ1517165.1 hypothetical protein HMI55_000470 [Coelomomyces lativittatus]
MQSELTVFPPVLLGVHFCPNTPYPAEKKFGKNIALIDTKTALPSTVNDQGCIILEANREYIPEPLDSDIMQCWNKLNIEEQIKWKQNTFKRRSSTSPSSLSSAMSITTTPLPFQQTKTPVCSLFSTHSATSPMFQTNFFSSFLSPSPPPLTISIPTSSYPNHSKSSYIAPSSTFSVPRLKQSSSALFSRVLRRRGTTSPSFQTRPLSVPTLSTLHSVESLPTVTSEPISHAPLSSNLKSIYDISISGVSLNTVPSSPSSVVSQVEMYTEFLQGLSIETNLPRVASQSSNMNAYSPSMEMLGQFKLKYSEKNIENCWTKLTSKHFYVYKNEKMEDDPEYSFSFPNDSIAIYDGKHSLPNYGFYFIYKYEPLHFITSHQSIALSWTSSINSVNVTAFDIETPSPTTTSYSFTFRREYQELLQSFDFIELTNTDLDFGHPSSLPKLVASLGRALHLTSPSHYSKTAENATRGLKSISRSNSSPLLSGTRTDIPLPQEKTSPTSVTSKQSNHSEQSANTLINYPDLNSVTLDTLIQLLMQHFERDSFFVHAFLLGHRHFSTTNDVIYLLLSKFQKSLPPTATQEEKDEYLNTQPLNRLRILRILRFWMDAYPFDFYFPTLRDLLSSFFRKLIKFQFDPSEPVIMVEEQQKYFRNLAQWMHRLLLSKRPRLGIPKTPTMKATKSYILQFDHHHIAYELTNAEHFRFKALRPLAFALKLWCKDLNETTEQEIFELKEMANAFNKISYWVATEICTQPELQQRVKTFEKLISIAKHCRRENNFNTCMAIIAGLNNASVLRLKETWRELSSKSLNTYRGLESLFSQSHNYSQYRQVLAALDRDRKTPFVPFFGLFMKDLYFFNENPIFPVQSGIDFTKIQSIVSLLVSLHAWQSIPYFPHDVPSPEKEYCSNMRALNESSLYKYSCLCEGKKGETKLQFSKTWTNEATVKKN